MVNNINDFKILDLPKGISVRVVSRTELRPVMDSLWNEVFPRDSDLKPTEISAEREKARSDIKKKFNDNIFCLDMVFTEDSTGLPIGWIISEQHDFETFYLRNSGFIPKFRRKGLYSKAHSAIVIYLKKLGFERIVSDHIPNNKPMLVLKLNAGYVINNMTIDDRFGPMVRVVKFLFEDRLREYEKRLRLPSYSE